MILVDVSDIAQNGLNWGNGAALVADVASAIIPGVPAVGGVMLKVAKAANAVDNVVDTANAVDNVLDTANAIDNAMDAGNAVDNLTDSAKTLENVPCMNSFRSDTDVPTNEGVKDIAAIEIGDHVLAWNEADGTLGYYEVTNVMVHFDPVLTELIIDGEWIETTPEHPFYVDGKGWTSAGDLRTGDEIRQADGTTGRVWLTWTIYRTQAMYNLTVDTAHTFFVGDGQWLVHNSGTCPFQGGRYHDLDTTLPDGTPVQRHHLVPDASSPIPKDDGPAIQMLRPDHYQTASYGWGNTPGSPFRETMDDLIANGRWRDAFAYAIRDVKRVAGSKYNPAIRQALDYADELGLTK